ncbi:RagB/SusD family nutrient uptake outer membrane protein [Polaribacter sp.]|uniref:RagB/SusD family nutrient uptake outer membrane protein n=1 Tax=Polaribacter sp. TaxID=1920175 RepID=UPI0040487131
MKKHKILLLAILGLIATSCNLDEEPPFLANENVYATGADASSALTGIYQSFTGNDYYGRDFLHATNINSGFGVTRNGGNSNTSVENATLASLKPNSGTTVIVNSWRGIYRTIARTNDAINSAIVSENPSTDDQMLINDVVGQAYFLRAFNYFNLVRLWGEVPLRLVPSTKENVHLGKSSIKDVYAQIISDTKRAQELMNGSVGNATVKPEAAAMLLAKVYMTLATAPTEHQEDGLNYWQLAYDEAIKVYGKYKLEPDYDDLFQDATGDVTEEAIFEIQSSELATMDHARAFTPTNYTPAFTFGRLQANYEVHDLHATTYPGDPRLESTFASGYTQQRGSGTGNPYQTYPYVTWRSRFSNGFPFVYKLGIKDVSQTDTFQNRNFIIYRYSDLLLMLAEISNELQNGEQLGYVTEVLDRVGLTPQAGYSGGLDAFRSAIMKEYQFELFFEGHDWFNNRRRGYDYFLNNVIIPHNTAPLFKSNVDVTLDTNEANVMYWPIPQIEIDGNELID